jgi:hypothetical protein
MWREKSALAMRKKKKRKKKPPVRQKDEGQTFQPALPNFE